MTTVYLDIETLPTQIGAERALLEAPFTALAKEAKDGLAARLAAIRAPANYKDPAKIAAWEAEERPKKVAELEGAVAAEIRAAEAKADDAYRRTSFDGALGQIAVIGFAFDNLPPVTLHAGNRVLSLAAEAEIIRKFYKALEVVPASQRATTRWVGHNLLGFDFPFLWQRSVVHGIQPPAWIPFRAKPWDDHVFDTMLAFAGDRGRIGQDKLCRVLGIDAKGSELGDEIDGSKVWDFVQAGRIADVATYCGGDVNRARELHRRMTFEPAPAPAAEARAVAA